MKILIFGSYGQLGVDLVDELSDYTVLRPKIDITKSNAVRRLIKREKPDFIINCAAYHNTQKCERFPLKTFQVNAFAAAELAKTKIPYVYISTDYVFDGFYGGYKEDDAPNPQNIYGLSKFLGEKLIQKYTFNYYIVRTSALFGRLGAAEKNYSNFPLFVLRNADKNLKIKSDEYISPTYTRDLASAIHELILRGSYGIYHLVNETPPNFSWYDFAKLVLLEAKQKNNVVPVKSSELSDSVKRGRDTSLSNTKGPLLPPIEDAVKRFINEIS